MYPIFKKGDIVFNEMTGNIILVTSDSDEKLCKFSGKVIRRISGSYERKDYPIGHFSTGWWKPVFKKHFIKLNNLKII